MEYSKYVKKYEEYQQTSKYGNAQNDVVDAVMVLIYLQNFWDTQYVHEKQTF